MKPKNTICLWFDKDAHEAARFQIATENQEETDRYWNAIVGNGGSESLVQLVQGTPGPLLADYPARASRRARGRWR